MRVIARMDDRSLVDLEVKDGEKQLGQIVTDAGKRYTPRDIVSLLAHGSWEPVEPVVKYNDNHDERGRFASSDGSSGGASSTAPKKEKHADNPTWKRVIKDIKRQGMGNCYQAAATLLMHASELGLRNPRVVQAMVRGQGELAGSLIGHSWLEADSFGPEDRPEGASDMIWDFMMRSRTVYDYSSGKSTELPADFYRAVAGLSEYSDYPIHEYTLEEALVKMLEIGTYGPWTDDIVERT